MAPNPSTRRFLCRSILALTLTVGVVTTAVGHMSPGAIDASRTVPAPAARSGSVLSAESATQTRPTSAVDASPRGEGANRAIGATVRTTSAGERPTPTLPKPKPAVESKGSRANGSTSSKAAAHHGRDHLWMPALGIDRSVAGYACSNSAYPGNRVYRWGCAGANNVYLFGHAHSVFKPLHDAYVDGRLRKGMELFYADGGGSVHRFTVSWWKVTTPTKGTWAYAALGSPGLTLQTCLGAKSEYRLIVRLARAD